jgi:DNA-binding MarR family transcriptional regulator
MTKASFTKLQGQYVAFIAMYTKVHGLPPAEADIQRYFRVTPPTVHQMVLTLEKREIITRVPGQARSISVVLSPDRLPKLE